MVGFPGCGWKVAAAALFVAVLGLGPQAAQAAPADSTVLTPAAARMALLFDGAGDEASPASVGGRTRSIPLALTLSAAVPGLGQAYNRQWVKAAVGLALEAVLIYAYFDALERGHDGEAAFQAYAHAHWDPVRYATWLNDYAAFLKVEASRIETAGLGVDFTSPGGWSDAERQTARRLFNQIRAVEGRVYHPETGASFSHKLPYFGEQQYYELIGKYFQFAPGWVDYPAWRNGETFTDAIDPEKTGPGGKKVNVQGRFWEYDDLSEDANNLLREASRMTALLLVNHLVAAIDAAVSAKLHNDRLATDVTLSYDPAGRVQPRATLRLRF